MIEIKNVLCPTDFSECADYAVQYGAQLARTFGAKLHLHHAVTVPYEGIGYEIGGNSEELRKRATEAARKLLAEKARAIRGTDLAVEEHLTVGVPFVDVITTARAVKADVIVIATHGWGFMKQVMIGSTAERVVRRAPCPVMTVKAKQGKDALSPASEVD